MAEDSKETNAVRLDLWLWSVRAFKTRSLAAQACRKGAVTIRGAEAKPSRLVRVGDELEVQKLNIKLRLKVEKLLTQRVGAKLVEEYCTDLTPEEEIDAARQRARAKWEGPQRESGTGRPTKKDRRAVDELGGAEEPLPEDIEADQQRRDELFEKWFRNSDL